MQLSFFCLAQPSFLVWHRAAAAPPAQPCLHRRPPVPTPLSLVRPPSSLPPPAASTSSAASFATAQQRAVAKELRPEDRPPVGRRRRLVADALPPESATVTLPPGSQGERGRGRRRGATPGGQAAIGTLPPTPCRRAATRERPDALIAVGIAGTLNTVHFGFLLTGVLRLSLPIAWCGSVARYPRNKITNLLKNLSVMVK